jgi:hypothetical protein
MFLVHRMSMWIINNMLTKSIHMVQGEHRGQDLLSVVLTRPEEHINKVLPIICDVKLSFRL